MKVYLWRNNWKIHYATVWFDGTVDYMVSDLAQASYSLEARGMYDEAKILNSIIEAATRIKRVEEARRTLEPKLRTVKTHLTALSDEFVIGSPMKFRIEFMNLGDAPVHYTTAGAGYFPLRVAVANLTA